MIRIAQVMGKMENGGVEAVVMNYYRHIDKSKIQFDFIVDSDSSCPQENEIIDLGGRVYRIAPYQNIKQNMKDLERIFKKNKYKIVHSHLTTMSVFSLAVAKKCGVPVRICHGHNTACKGETKKNIMKYALRPFSKIFATHYFACSNYAGKWLYGKNILKSPNYKIIPNAIEIEKFRFDPIVRNKIRKELGIENKFVIGHIGRFVYQKNHDFLLDIFYELLKKKKDSVLLLIGEGELIQEVKNKVHRLKIDNYVKFLGVKNNTYQLYQAFDVFLLPSRYEGLPVVGVEAQISGVPCIFSSSMTKETKFTDNLVFIDKESGKEKWVNQILSVVDSKRNQSVNSDKFDISIQGGKLTYYYVKLYK